MANRNNSKPSIWFADDDPEDQGLLISAFHQITDEYYLTAVKSGQALVELLALTGDSELPCLIVLDYNMPGMDGKQTLKLLQNNKRYRNIPKVIYSSSALESDRLEFISNGAKAYLIKPNSIGEILCSARKMLDHCNRFLVPVA